MSGRRLVPPPAFAVATEEYRLDEDALSRFLEEECEITGNAEDRGDLGGPLRGYRSFVRDNGGALV